MIIRKNIFFKKSLLCSIFSVTLILGATEAYSEEPKNVITIYSSIMPGAQYARLFRAENALAIPGYAIVRQQKEITFKAGPNKIIFTGIPSSIDPTTVMLKSLTYPDHTQLIAEEYRFDLRNNQELLQKYIGHEVTAEQNTATKIESYTGKLLSVVGGVILEDKNGDIISLNNYSMIRFPKLNPGIYTEPTLICDVTTDKSGVHNIETTYLTEGLSWWTEYNAVFYEIKDNETMLDLSAWVSIVNKSGTAYNGMQVNLMAGELNRVSSPMPMLASADMSFKAGGNQGRAGFSETPFFEYHLYRLQSKINLQDDSIKQLELFPKISQIPVEVQYLYSNTDNIPYYGQPNINREPGIPFNAHAETFIKFKNSKQAGLGMPLPSGRFRINKADASGGLLLIGESIIQHTPKEQDIRLKLGTAFDITIERKQTNFILDEQRRTMEESFELTIKNQKAKNVVITVRENLFRAANWKITNNSEKFEKKDTQTIEFQLPVQKEGEAKLSYTVKYTY